ncbi:MAG: thioredoxin domain-containing protein [Patescibacteria group bacterium]
MYKSKKLFLILLVLFAIALVIIFFVRQDKLAVNNNDELKLSNEDIINGADSIKIEEVKDINEADHYLGDLNAPVQVIIYSDFDCPFSAAFYDTFEKIKAEFSNQVVIAFRHYYLSSHPLALSASLAAECAAEQDKFWEMHDKLFMAKKEDLLSTSRINEEAANIGLDLVKFSNCLETEKYKDKIDEQMLAGSQAGVIGTPTIFVNKEILPGAYPFENFIDQDGVEQEGMKNIIKGQLES